MVPREARSTRVSTMTLDPATTTRAALDFDALYRDARDDVYAYVVTLLHDRGAAEDVTAQAFEKAFRKAGTYDSRRGGERAWLFGIARNAALDELRRRKRTAALATDPHDPVSASTEDAVQRAVERAAVRAALDNAELAAVLGVSPTNAGTLLHRAMNKLREAVDDRA